MNGKYTLTYDRYHETYTKEFNTAREAAQWAYDQEMEGRISWDNITNPNGNAIAHNFNGEGYSALYSLGANDVEGQDE